MIRSPHRNWHQLPSGGQIRVGGRSLERSVSVPTEALELGFRTLHGRRCARHGSFGGFSYVGPELGRV